GEPLVSMLTRKSEFVPTPVSVKLKQFAEVSAQVKLLAYPCESESAAAGFLSDDYGIPPASWA
ncbi:MAG: hypothetical protein ACRD2B_19135, partial [Terriglobia bacterium]